MPKVPRALRQAAFFVLALCLSLFLQFRSHIPDWTILHHDYRLEPGALALSAALIYGLLVGLWALYSEIRGKTCRMPYKAALADDFWTYLPILFFALTPLALRHYLTSDDLEKRLGLFLTAVIASVFYLKAIQIARTAAQGPPPWLAWLRRFFGLPLRRQIAILFFAAVLVYNGGSLLIMSQGITFSGDEPHYLLITQSLLADGDFDLADNYARQDYSRYMPKGVEIRAHAQPGKKPGSQYSMHSPGVSFWLLPFYALGTLLGRSGLLILLRFGMSLVGALFGIQMYLFALKEWDKDRLALGLWALFSFTSPVFFYSIHVYPEIVVALFVFTAFRWLRDSAPLTKPRLLLLGFFMSSFIWFHALKYFFILAPLFLYALIVLLKKQNNRKDLAWFLAVPVVNFLLYFAFQYSLYGSLNPTAVSWQGAMDERQTVSFLKELLTGIPFRFRLETLVGYFLDQRDGLLLYAPVYFFSVLGLAEMIRRKGRDALLLLVLAAPYVLVSAFLTQRGGYSPQARPLVAVIWVPAIFMGAFLAHRGRTVSGILCRFAAAASFLIVWLLCRNPYALYQETTVGATERGGLLFYLLSHLHFYLPTILPSFLKVEDWRWTPNFVWPAALLAVCLVYVLARRRTIALTFGRHATLACLGLALFFAWFVFFPRITLVPPRPAALPGGEKLTFYALSRVALMREPAKFALLEDDRDYHFYFTSGRPIRALKTEFGSLHGDYELKFGFFDAPAFTAVTRKEMKEEVLESPPAYPWRGLNLYRVTIRLGKKSDVRTGITPYVLGFRPLR